MVRGVHNPDQGDDTDAVRAVPVADPIRAVPAYRSLEDADVFDPEYEPEFELVRPADKRMELYFEPDSESRRPLASRRARPVRARKRSLKPDWRPRVRPSVKRDGWPVRLPWRPNWQWRPANPTIRNNAPALVLTLLIVAISLGLVATLFSGSDGGTEVVAGPDLEQPDESSDDGGVSNDPGSSSSSAAGLDSEDAGSTQTTGSDPVSSTEAAPPPSKASTSKAVTPPRPRTTTATTAGTRSTLDGSSSSGSVSSVSSSTSLPTTATDTDGSQPTTGSSGSTSSTDPEPTSSSSPSSSSSSSVPAPRITQFGNVVAAGGTCANGRTPYDISWATVGADSVELGLPGGTTIGGGPAGSHRTCGISGQQATLTAFGPGGQATATTTLG